MNPNLLISICAIMLVSHGAFLIAHPHRMRSDPKDAPRDRKGFRDLTGLTIALQLTLQGTSGRPIRIESTLEGFDQVLRRALAAVGHRELTLDPTTTANLAALGLDRNDPAAGALTPAASDHGPARTSQPRGSA